MHCTGQKNGIYSSFCVTVQHYSSVSQWQRQRYGGLLIKVGAHGLNDLLKDKIKYNVTMTACCPECGKDFNVGTAGPAGLSQHTGKSKCRKKEETAERRRDRQEETHRHRNEMRHIWWRTTHLSNVPHIDGKCQSLIQECVSNLIHVIPYYFDKFSHNIPFLDCQKIKCDVWQPN